jgi:hypothetical protein
MLGRVVKPCQRCSTADYGPAETLHLADEWLLLTLPMVRSSMLVKPVGLAKDTSMPPSEARLLLRDRSAGMPSSTGVPLTVAMLSFVHTSGILCVPVGGTMWPTCRDECC